MYTNSIQAVGNGIKIVRVDFQTEEDVSTFEGEGEFVGDGVFQDYAFKFDGADPPDSLTYAITDDNGLSIASGTITASTARDNLGASLPVSGLRLALSGNSTNNAKGFALFYFLV